jgi:hypothetical protein
MAECISCGQRKMSVTRYEDGLGYVCFRASCPTSGSVTEGARLRDPRSPFFTPPFKPTPFFGEHQAYGYANAFIGDDHSAFDVYNTSDGHAAVFYLTDFAHCYRGWQRRTINKSLTSGKQLPGPLYGVYGGARIGETGSLWVVEDPKSAIVLARRGRPALTLLGTRLDVAVLDELWDAYPDCRRIYVALDPGAEDAAREAVRLCRMERGLDAIQVPLPDDIHRLDQDTLTKLLEAYP